MEFFILFIIAFGVIAVLRTRGKGKTKRAWKTIGYYLGLQYFDTPNPSLTGIYHNRSVKIKLDTENHGSSSQMYTRFEVEYRKPIQTVFQVTRQGYLFEKSGIRDIEIGFPDFDKSVLVKAHSEDEVRDFFQSKKARSTCLGVINRSGFTKVKISNHKIVVSVTGLLVNVENAESVLKKLINAASILEGEATSPPEKEKPKKQKQSPPPLPSRKETPVVPEEWHGEPEVITETVPLPFNQPETNNDEALVPELHAPAPPEDELLMPRPEPEPVSATPPDLISNSISVANVTAELFESKIGKYEAGKRFDGLFKGEEVNWTCLLRNIEPGSSDRVFGRDSGWIAIFDLGSFPDMESGSGPLLVKYRIGSEQLAEFKSHEASEFEIAGELVKYNPFTTTLYIDSGAPAEKESSPGNSRFVSYAERIKKEMHSRPGEVKRFS